MEQTTPSHQLTRHYYADGIEITEELANTLYTFNVSVANRGLRIPVLMTLEHRPKLSGNYRVYAETEHAMHQYDDNDRFALYSDYELFD